MERWTIDIADVADLPTQVAHCGAVQAGEMVADAMYEHIIGIVILVHQQHPA